MKRRTLTAALLLIIAAAAAHAQQPPSPPKSGPSPTPTPAPAATPSPTPQAQPALKQSSSDAKKKYDALLDSAKKGEGAVDYKALRFAFFETPDYNPLTGMMNYRALWGLVMQQNWPEAAKQSEAVLAKNYVDINAHMVAHIAYRQQGNTEKAAHHRRWADGLIESIKASGDGKSPATAWEVISISEEYAVIRSMGVRATGQSLVNVGGHSYDAMKIVDPRTNTEMTLFFNVDKPFSAYGRK
jgi:uncharacterized protein DUF4919